MTLVNIIYKGQVLEDVSHLPFRQHSPRMYVVKCNDFKIIIFPNRKCRLMGCKKPITTLNNLPYKIAIKNIQLITVTFDMGMSINLYHLASKVNCRYDPELFPALRLLDYNPLCVNVFASGKVVILGIKHLNCNKHVHSITEYLHDNLNQ